MVEEPDDELIIHEGYQYRGEMVIKFDNENVF